MLERPRVPGMTKRVGCWARLPGGPGCQVGQMGFKARWSARWGFRQVAESRARWARHQVGQVARWPGGMCAGWAPGGRQVGAAPGGFLIMRAIIQWVDDVLQGAFWNRDGTLALKGYGGLQNPPAR